jgi:hypothetical protein
MKKSRWLAAGGLAILVVVGGLAAWWYFAKSQVKVEIEGQPGMKLVGTVRADREELHVEMPLGRPGVANEIKAPGRNVSWSLDNVGEPGTVTIRVFVNGKLADVLTADAEHPIVRGTVEHGRVSQSAEKKTAN